MLVLRRQDVVCAAIYAILYCILDMQMSSEHSANSSVRATCFSAAWQSSRICTVHTAEALRTGETEASPCAAEHTVHVSTRHVPNPSSCSLQTKTAPVIHSDV